MANVKSRVNTTKTASTKINGKGKVGRPKKSIINVQNVTGKDALKRQLRRKDIEVLPEITPNSDNKDKKVGNTTNLKKLLSKSGHIRHKNKIDIKIFDKILKSELQIEDNNRSLRSEVRKTRFNNNNDIQVLNAQKDRTSEEIVCVDNNKIEKDTEVTTSSNKFKKIAKNINYKNTTIFTNGQLFICDYCNKEFNTRASIRRHLFLHDKVTSYSCPQCKKYFSNHLYLAAHTKRQHPNWEKHFMCNICDRPYLLKSNLKLHLASHSRNEKMFKCIYCKEKFADQYLLIDHEKQHLVDGKYLCIICETAFDCRNRLTFHYRSHLKVKDFVCQHCGKEFLRMNSVRRHVQVCHSGHRLQCKICKKYLKGHLSEHMRTHDKNRPHECPDCGQRFTQSTQLTVHRRSHTGVRPYTCRICQRPFSHSNALMLHIRRHTGEKPFSCAMCPISFSQLPHMKAHMCKIHGKEDPYRCQNCKQFFKLKVGLEEHLKSCIKTKKGLEAVEKEDLNGESPAQLSRMRFLLALLLTMIATKEKLKILGFNKRLIDDLLVESLEAMRYKPCKDKNLTSFNRLKINIEMLLEGTVPSEQMEKLKKDNKTTEQILELLTDEKKRN
ncbi:unnamed protein product [Pieris macdunnoughi]|uniref:C2H2-type domain-containing protein n=1 Tax=Pieris macdunnoughi TaxID=345717 RepID=A0A821SYB1_9NEOP|nr:unnamed protein product [Pieris macdunnoughi]